MVKTDKQSTKILSSTWSTVMKYVFVFGGLGNQLFQLSFAHYLQSISNERVLLIDFTELYQRKRVLHIEGGELEFCKVPHLLKVFLYYSIRILVFFKTRRLMSWFRLCSEIMNETDYKNKFFYGYWQDKKFAMFAKQKIVELLNLEFSDKIESTKIGVHCRRGDYYEDKNMEYQTVTKLYFEEGVNYLLSKYPNSPIQVFSDDKSWCLENLTFSHEENVYSNLSSDGELIDFKQLIGANHFVISNSTFSWWASFLAKCDDKVIVVPEKWSTGVDTKQTKLYLDGMHYARRPKADTKRIGR